MPYGVLLSTVIVFFLPYSLGVHRFPMTCFEYFLNCMTMQSWSGVTFLRLAETVFKNFWVDSFVFFYQFERKQSLFVLKLYIFFIVLLILLVIIFQPLPLFTTLYIETLQFKSSYLYTIYIYIYIYIYNIYIYIYIYIYI